MVYMVSHEAFACRCAEGDVVLRQSYKPESYGKLYYACPKSKEHVYLMQDDKSLPPYDPIENYISPRPKYLRFNRDRHRKIFARQENVSRMIKGVSYDCGVSFLEEVSSDDCSIEEMEDLVKESLVGTHAENECEKEEFDEV
ncbi:hypothetical protein Tco_0615081 [Tanacetum coccineum]